MRKKVVVRSSLQEGYIYYLTEPEGKRFHPEFKPELTPREMLKLGVFGGNYFDEVPKEFPKAWFRAAKLSTDGEPHRELNCFGVLASQSRLIWQKNGWIHSDDPRGWFEWYCRYYLGRRHADDERQISRWKAMRRHVSQIVHNCMPRDYTCRRRQRQAVLHWAYDSRKM